MHLVTVVRFEEAVKLQLDIVVELGMQMRQDQVDDLKRSGAKARSASPGADATAVLTCTGSSATGVRLSFRLQLRHERGEHSLQQEHVHHVRDQILRSSVDPALLQPVRGFGGHAGRSPIHRAWGPAAGPMVAASSSLNPELVGCAQFKRLAQHNLPVSGGGGTLPVGATLL
jgi:hypothetical protein